MSTNEDSNSSGTNAAKTIITDIDGNPVKIDNNAAHFDGFLREIHEFVLRTGTFAEFFEHGITFKGYKTVVDAASAVPFILGTL